MSLFNASTQQSRRKLLCAWSETCELNHRPAILRDVAKTPVEMSPIAILPMVGRVADSLHRRISQPQNHVQKVCTELTKRWLDGRRGHQQLTKGNILCPILGSTAVLQPVKTCKHLGGKGYSQPLCLTSPIRFGFV